MRFLDRLEHLIVERAKRLHFGGRGIPHRLRPAPQQLFRREVTGCCPCTQAWLERTRKRLIEQHARALESRWWEKTAVVLAVLVAGCDLFSPNERPVETLPLPDITVEVGDSATVDLARHFTDPDSYVLWFEAVATGPVTVAVLEDILTVTATAKGEATVTVTAMDDDEASVSGVFRVTVPNRPPVRSEPWPDIVFGAGDSATVDLSAHYADPDGDPLTFTAGGPGVTLTGSRVVLHATSARVYLVDVTASDGEATVQDIFAYEAESRYAIELVFATEVSVPIGNAFRRAADRWEAAFATMDLPDVGPFDCGGVWRAGATDDLAIRVQILPIDGLYGILGYAGPCAIRSDGLPVGGHMTFDSDDLEWLRDVGQLDNTIMHEIAHVLGLGSLWSRFGLLEDPSLVTPGADTHFTGPKAIAAFDAAGGRGYAGAKVPVENAMGPGSGDSHWREGVMGSELMTPTLNGGPNALSAVTLESLADMGYTVDLSVADEWTLAAPVHYRGKPVAIHLHGDVWRGPITVVR